MILKMMLCFLAGMFFGIIVSCILLARRNLALAHKVEDAAEDVLKKSIQSGKDKYNEIMGIPNEWEDGKPRYSVHAYDKVNDCYEELRDAMDLHEAEIISLKAADDIMKGELTHDDGVTYTDIRIYEDARTASRHPEFSKLFEIVTPTDEGGSLERVKE